MRPFKEPNIRLYKWNGSLWKKTTYNELLEEIARLQVYENMGFWDRLKWLITGKLTVNNLLQGGQSNMKVKEIIKELEILRVAIKSARSPQETLSIQFEINRLEDLKVSSHIGEQRYMINYYLKVLQTPYCSMTILQGISMLPILLIAMIIYLLVVIKITK